MTREDYAFVADALLTLCANDKKAPFYTEANYDLQLRKDRKNPPLHDRIVGLIGHDDIERQECRRILDRAALTRRQHDVFSRRIDGQAFESIGRAIGSTKQSAQSTFLAALKKISRAAHVYPYTGLSDVYRQEVRRGARSGSFGRMRA